MFAIVAALAAARTTALSVPLALSSLKKPSPDGRPLAAQNSFAAEAASYREEAAKLRREADAMTDELIRDRKARDAARTPLALATKANARRGTCSQLMRVDAAATKTAR